jgi:NAD(P)-dependent dehydrogenase (short-subunit alcohol dehydrogenase family)
MKLKDKVAIITGAGRGIGRAYALRFAEEGAKVVVADIVVELAQKVGEKIQSNGGEALAISVNVSDGTSVQEMVKKTMDRFGGIDILVNNAAHYRGIGLRTWTDWTVEEWKKIWAVNVTGGWLCAKAVFPYMRAQGKGKIINMSCAANETGFAPLLPHTCSKGGVVSMTRALARALGGYGISVNCISPGYTLTESTVAMPGRRQGIEIGIGFSRLIRRAEFEEDIPGTAVFLSSDDSDFITGQTIAVDGGQTLH